MKSFVFIGIAACAGGILTFLFQSIAGLMGHGEPWIDIRMLTVGGSFGENLLDKVPVDSLYEWLAVIYYDIPLYQVLFGVGILCLIIGSFAKR